MYRFAFWVVALFGLAIAPAAAQTLTIVGGDGQHLARESSRYIESGIAVFGPLSVALRDARGKGIANASVTFHCNHEQVMSCQLTPPGTDHGTVTVKTDGNGIATLDAMLGKSLQVYYADGPFTVTASSGNRAVTFHLAVVPLKREPVGWVKGAKLTIVTGANQRVTRRTSEAHFGPIAVRLVAPDGRPIANAPIHFDCGIAVYSACQLTAAGDDNGQLTLKTDGNGVATLNRIGGNSMGVSHIDGAFVMRATYGDIAAATIPFTVVKSGR